MKIFLFVVILLFVPFARQSDLNSNIQAQMMWSYLQLRPADVYSSSQSITVDDIARQYYGDISYSPLIYGANSASIYLESGIVAANQVVILPSIIKCVEFMPTDCFQNSPLLGGTFIPTLPNVSSITFNMSNEASFQNRRLLEEQSFNLSPQPLMQQTFNDEPILMSLTIENGLATKIQNYQGGPLSVAPKESLTLSENTDPSKILEYTFHFYSAFGVKFFLKVSIYVAPLPLFPFYYSGEKNYVQVRVFDSSGITQVFATPQVLPTKTSLTFITSNGLTQPNLNITLSITNALTRTRAFVSLKEAHRKEGANNLWAGADNTPRQIWTDAGTSYVIEYINATTFYNFLLSNKQSTKAWQAWRTLSVDDYGNYRFVNLYANLALALNPAASNFVMETPDVTRSNQVWMCIPSYKNDARFFIRGENNLCWTINQSEGAMATAVYPIRLALCNVADSKQLFRADYFYSSIVWS